MWATRGRAPRSERRDDVEEAREGARARVHSPTFVRLGGTSSGLLCFSLALSGPHRARERLERETERLVTALVTARCTGRTALVRSELDRPDPRPGHDPPPLGRGRPSLLGRRPVSVAERLLDVLRQGAVEAVPVRVRQLVLGAPRVGVQVRDGLARLGVDLAGKVVDEAL